MEDNFTTRLVDCKFTMLLKSDKYLKNNFFILFSLNKEKNFKILQKEILKIIQ